MKNLLLLFIGVLSFTTISFNGKTNLEEKKFNDSFSKVLLHAKAYTIEIANAMPAEYYTFKPDESVRTFGEQMTHIGMSTGMILHRFIKGEEMKMDMAENMKIEKSIGKSKEDVIKLLNNSFDDAINSLKKMSEEDLRKTFVFPFSPDKPELSNRQGFLFLRDHITHHRGQAIIYLRMKGIKPPAYRAF